MNRIILIGNGFDLAHGLKTKYEDFINWYWDYRVRGFVGNLTEISQDVLCTFKDRTGQVWNVSAFNGLKVGHVSGTNVINYIRGNKDYFDTSFTPFFENICKSIETKGWVDIENEYYHLLTKYALINNSETELTGLNNQLHYLQERLIDYLSLINQEDIAINDNIRKNIYAPIKSNEVSIGATKTVKDYVDWWKNRQRNSWEHKQYEYGMSGLKAHDYLLEIEDYKKDDNRDYPRLFMLPDNIMLLSFNYTKTAQAYLKKDSQNFILNYIHGKIENPQSVIFGYGDELDDDYKRLQKLNDNECLCNVKTIKYQESDNYRKLLAFAESAPYQVCIMGHSCGNSDRTLLNTLFEHKNCISIKPYYYIKEDGTDNYLELVQNISRNFTDMKLMRDRVVNKMYCEPLT